MAAAASVVIPIVAKLNGKEIELGELSIDVKMSGTRIKPLTAREVKAALRKALR